MKTYLKAFGEKKTHKNYLFTLYMKGFYCLFAMITNSS